MAVRGNIPPGKVQKLIYLDEEVERRLRIAAAEQGESQSALMERALRRELGMANRRIYS